jgi:hypothetical protein
MVEMKRILLVRYGARLRPDRTVVGSPTWWVGNAVGCLLDEHATRMCASVQCGFHDRDAAGVLRGNSWELPPLLELLQGVRGGTRNRQDGRARNSPYYDVALRE